MLFVHTDRRALKNSPSVRERNSVADYTLHFLDSGAQAGPVLHMDCPDDRRAIEEAAKVPHVHRMELWRQDRRVWTFEAPDALRQAG